MSLYDDVLREMYPETPDQLDRMTRRSPSPGRITVIRESAVVTKEPPAPRRTTFSVGVCHGCGARDVPRIRGPHTYLPACSECAR